MTILAPNTELLTLPKIDRCYEHSCNLYQLILQKRATNRIIVFKLRDISSGHPLRYAFPFFAPDCMEGGEYNLFLVRDAEWQKNEVDGLYIKDTYRQTDKQAITLFGQYILSGDRVMVSAAKHVDTGLYDEKRGISYISTEYSDDPSPIGDIYEDLEVIYTGLLKYITEDTPGFVEPGKTKDYEYTEYNG